MTGTTKPSKKKTVNHPPFWNMIQEAIAALKERNGSSRQAIIKYITSHFKVDNNVDSHVRRALLQGLKSTKLVQTKGKGASGSFKLAEKVKKQSSKTIVKSKTKKESSDKVSEKKEKKPLKTKKVVNNKTVKVKKSPAKTIKSPAKKAPKKKEKPIKVAKTKTRKPPKKNPSSRGKKIK